MEEQEIGELNPGILSIDIAFEPEEWGKIGMEELRRLCVRYPYSHKKTLEGLLKRFSSDLAGLGNFLRENPVISEIHIDVKTNKFDEMLKNELRKKLGQWRDFIKKKFQSLTLRLFTDGQEVIFAEDINGRKKRIRFIRRGRVSLDTMQERMEKLSGLIPEVEIYDEGKDYFLTITAYIEGRYAEQEDIERFKQKLIERGLDPNNFDLNPGNIIVDDKGNSFLVDMEEILIGF